MLHPAKEQVVDLATFKPDLVEKDWKKIFKLGSAGRPSSLFFHPIETLTPIKTVGLGVTHLNLEMATSFNTFAQPPFAGFDRSMTPFGNPAVDALFQPWWYGITTISSFVVTFYIEVTGQSTFDVSGSGSHFVSEVLGGGLEGAERSDDRVSDRQGVLPQDYVGDVWFRLRADRGGGTPPGSRFRRSFCLCEHADALDRR